MQGKLGLLVGSLLVVGACNNTAAGGQGQFQQGALNPAYRPGPSPSALGHPVRPTPHYLITGTTLWLRPQAGKSIPDPLGSGEMIDNWVGNLTRATDAVVTRAEGDFCFIMLAAQAEGWVECKTLLPKDASSLATVLEAAPAYSEPNALQPLDKGVEPGSLLVATESRNGFTRVNLDDNRWVWVKADQVSTDPTEVGVARLIAKIQLKMTSPSDEDIIGLRDVARTKFPKAQLLPVLEQSVPIGLRKNTVVPKTGPAMEELEGK